MIIYAHRGARGYAPENTMAAFQHALALQADGIELDVQATRDGEIVVCHDHTVDRTSNGTGWIRDLTLKELKKLDFGSWFAPGFAAEPIPTFAEFFAWYVKTSLLLNIEIKNGPVIYDGIEEQLLTLITSIAPAAVTLYDRIIISSFYHPSLIKIKELDARFKTGALFSCRPLDPVALAKQTNADYLHPHWHYLEPHWIRQARENGVGVNSYTINSAEEFHFASKMNITGIFSDYPDRWL